MPITSNYTTFHISVPSHTRYFVTAFSDADSLSRYVFHALCRFLLYVKNEGADTIENPTQQCIYCDVFIRFRGNFFVQGVA
jgi:hypothetical protein